jgi:hypothetical protein
MKSTCCFAPESLDSPRTLRDEAQSVPANIRDGMGKNPGRIATGSIAMRAVLPKRPMNTSAQTSLMVVYSFSPIVGSTTAWWWPSR